MNDSGEAHRFHHALLEDRRIQGRLHSTRGNNARSAQRLLPEQHNHTAALRRGHNHPPCPHHAHRRRHPPRCWWYHTVMQPNRTRDAHADPRQAVLQGGAHGYVASSRHVMVDELLTRVTLVRQCPIGSSEFAVVLASLMGLASARVSAPVLIKGAGTRSRFQCVVQST